MKYIVKGNEPVELTKRKSQLNTNRRKLGRKKIKDIIRRALMNEQGHICCYCERRIVEGDCHIEHFRPQSDGVDPLDYSNMLCSCLDQIEERIPRHCGYLKGDWFDEDLLISPLNKDCENHFSFTADGQILPKYGDKAADETIKRLGLNIPKLQDMRKQVISPFIDENLTDDDYIRFVNGYLKMDSEGRFNPFFTTIRYLFVER
ncbi:MAG: retron system putative HNH endonuclease [Candidatus Omnitrophota bacterium]